MGNRSTPAGYTAIPKEVKAFALAYAPWAMPVIEFWYDQARGDRCRATYDQAREHLAALPHARTRQGTIPSRWSIARFMDALRDRGYLSTDRQQNRAEGARFGCCVFTLAAWVKNRLRLRRINECNTAVLHGPTEGKPPSIGDRVLHGSATPVQDNPLSEEKRVSYARQLRARFGRPPLNTAQQRELAC